MLTTPDRLSGVIESIEQGEAVDTGKVLLLLELDTAKLGQDFVGEALRLQEEADAGLYRGQ